jgi:hypothetical protein
MLAPVIDSDKQQEQYLQQGIPSEIKAVMHDFADLFAEPDDLPHSRLFDHAISLMPGTIPINSRPYRYSPQQKDKIEQQVAKMLKSGLVTSSLSPFASPVLLAKKKDGTWRFCVDYTKMNAATIKNKFLMPIIDEFLDEIDEAAYFTKLDLNSRFHQIRMAPEDESKLLSRLTMDISSLESCPLASPMLQLLFSA